jgi:hypothetical protein
MRKISLFISLILLFGCEKYVLPTDPKLSGQWVVDAVTFPNTNSGQQPILSDTVVVADRNLVSVDGNGVGRFVNNWSDPNIPWHDKFIVGKTVWEFETNLVGLPDRNNSGSPMYRNWDYYFISGDLIERDYKNILKITSIMSRTYTIVQYGLNTMTLKIPKVWTMYRYNGETYFLREDIRLTLVRI